MTKPNWRLTTRNGCSTLARMLALMRSTGGMGALRQVAPRSELTPAVTAEVESHIVEVTLHSKPALEHAYAG